MILSKTTFMKTHMICNLHNNISGMKDVFKEEDYVWIEDILDDLKYAYENNKEDYLMNLTSDLAVQEIIDISEKWNVLTNSYPFGKYEKIGAEKYEF